MIWIQDFTRILSMWQLQCSEVDCIYGEENMAVGFIIEHVRLNYCFLTIYK